MGCWNSKIPAEIPSEVEIESSANTEASTDTETSNSLSDHEQMVLQTGPQAGFNSIQPNFEYENQLNYNMDHKERGHFLIFNHYEFDDKRYEARDGTQEDRKKLEIVFGQLGFRVKVYDDCTYEKIIQKLTEVAKQEDHSQNDCFACCILTHGELNGILKAKDKVYERIEVFQLFIDSECSSLAGKPKIFIVQACRGNRGSLGAEVAYDCSNGPCDTLANSNDTKEYDEVDANENEDQFDRENITTIIPDNRDFLIALSTTKGNSAYRNLNGSWFIQELTTVMQEYLLKSDDEDIDNDFLSLLTTVNRSVSKHESHSDQPHHDKKKQVSNITHTLTKRIYFRPKENACNDNNNDDSIGSESIDRSLGSYRIL